MKATAPGRTPGTSPAPRVATTRTLTIGRSCRSTKSTRMPLGIDHDAIFGGVQATAPEGGGGVTRKGASGVTRVGSGVATDAAAGGAVEDGEGVGSGAGCRAGAHAPRSNNRSRIPTQG